MLKLTHAPIVSFIHAYEFVSWKLGKGDGFDSFRGPRSSTFSKRAAPPHRRPESRPQSAYRPSVPSPLPSGADAFSAAQPQPRRSTTEDDTGAAPSDVEIRISELSEKIDRLTALVVSLQAGSGLQEVRT